MSYTHGEFFEADKAYVLEGGTPYEISDYLTITRLAPDDTDPFLDHADTAPYFFDYDYTRRLPSVIGRSAEGIFGKGELLLGDEDKLLLKFSTPIKAFSFRYRLSVGLTYKDLHKLEYIDDQALVAFDLQARRPWVGTVLKERLPAKSAISVVERRLDIPSDQLLITGTVLGSVHFDALQWTPA